MSEIFYFVARYKIKFPQNVFNAFVPQKQKCNTAKQMISEDRFYTKIILIDGIYGNLFFFQGNVSRQIVHMTETMITFNFFSSHSTVVTKNQFGTN